ncbi:hypothetical protein IEO21_00581 [Rhodonia placenta]|uniref:Prolyl 4-hydroxylase alpha subunit domain-containing protein n=2 Tax=Rhodonia placenta TaxID=104341 RepID=A0A1X6N8Y9_9APHY|nr:hypothetical protein POSPLADRAFT_1073350 [Postia placenta MAD-698-R-SB12]KAF9821335.1 hypothetical protein IEO21_00581 [Postia placenta]OSX65099.1 hypothetical protein POSPLADRAFT_1073350 [Postia placenta MAD-698-R-SB12]
MSTPLPRATANVQFPAITQKHRLEARTFLEDQIILLDGVLSPEECKNYVKFIDNQPLELTPPKKRGEAARVNYRISITSTEMANRLYEVLSPHLPPFPYPESAKRPGTSTRPAHSFNSNIRLYKYTPGQYFGQHYDDTVCDSVTGAKSEWTLLVYLTGAEDGVKGGQTLFFRTHRGNASDAMVPPLKRGMALLHRHGPECLLHEGSPVLEGVKYVLRSDLMFMD